MNQREKFENFLKKVTVFETMDAYERGSLSDCLITSEVTGKGSVIFKEGDSGQDFYLVMEGTLSAYKTSAGTDKAVYDYKEGDYFGELSLLKDLPRQATIKTTSEYVKLATINNASFRRVLGSLKEILERNADRYEKYMKENGITL